MASQHTKRSISSAIVWEAYFGFLFSLEVLVKVHLLVAVKQGCPNAIIVGIDLSLEV